MKNKVKQAQRLTPEIMLDILAYLNLNKQTDLVFWAILVIGFFGMLHKSNLIPDSVDTFDGVKLLMHGHVYFVGEIVILRITWAKNLQCRQKVLEIPLMPIPGSTLCLITVLKLLLAKSGSKHLPLFNIKGCVAFTYAQFHNKFRKVLKKAGYREKAFSSHSMRRGSVVWAFWSGVPESLIKVHGNWSSDVYKQYLEFQVEIRALVSLKMRQKIMQLE